ncbi:MAG TPA: hypothetical protein VGM57_14840 [Pseudolabrys sp.]|jgi:hypothetical protein
MKIRSAFIYGLGIAALALGAANPAAALTMKECSVKYKAAQTAGTLNGQKWQDFRKAQCSDDAAAKPAATTTTAAPAAAPAPKPAPAPAATAAKPAAPAPTAAAKPAMAPAAPAGNAVFPKAIDPKYAKETPGKGRMKTCVDQYDANKATNSNGGLKWIVKGGGYWSECNKALKG